MKGQMKVINLELLAELNRKYHLNIEPKPLIVKAFTHSSYGEQESNERLEFLGDSVLGMLVATYLYRHFPHFNEGEMTKMRATYVCEDANSQYAKEMGLDKMILLGKGEELSGARRRPSTLSDLFEAFLGAVYLEYGIDEVKKILDQVVFPHLLANDVKPFIDYKSRLQEALQADGPTRLVYRLDNVEGPPHNRTFTMSAVLDGVKLGTGVGRTKKDATQDAAREALKTMAIIK
ncbi:MAG: Ribonuclease 3 [Tenericutes bacterium ADurb.Bin140]|nr:MAG: Ribonuclease 3 [Tenericutes bacterium ADurb.Bin140]